MTDNIPLSKRYESIVAKISALEESRLRQDSDEFQLQLNEAITQITQVKNQITSLSLFSDNEPIDEVSTNEIKYLCVDYYTATLFIKFLKIDKLRNLNIAKHLFLQFLFNLENYSILPHAMIAKLDSFKSNFSPELSELVAKDPTTRRIEKIANYKYEKQLTQKLEILANSNIDNMDDEVVRELYIDQLKLFSIKTFSSLELVLMELQVLANKPEPKIEDITNQENFKMDQDKRSQSYNDDELGYTDKLETLSKPLLSKTGKILRPFTIYSTRDQIKRKVYGTGQELPAMSVEEYLDVELANGKMMKPEEPEEEFDEENEYQVDQATYKERYWDEFKENNQKGSGNTMNIG